MQDIESINILIVMTTLILLLEIIVIVWAGYEKFGKWRSGKKLAVFPFGSPMTEKEIDDMLEGDTEHHYKPAPPEIEYPDFITKPKPCPKMPRRGIAPIPDKRYRHIKEAPQPRQIDESITKGLQKLRKHYCATHGLIEHGDKCLHCENKKGLGANKNEK